METFTSILEFLTYWLVDQYWFPAFLIGTGIFFTIYLGFPQIKYFRHGWRVLTGKYIKEDTEGDTTPFQALTTALSGTVGTGNIGGVALAIFLGGPAAIFWMWVTAFLGMTTKFVEVTLSHKYREKLPDGSMSGGPMYYIENGLNMKWLAVVFSVCLLLMCIGTGNMPQISSISVVLLDTFNIPKIVTGLVLSVLVWLVIIGGIKRIAQIASKLVPFMAFWYIVGGLAVIFSNYENIIPSFQSIFVHIFTPTAAVGGFLGASVAAALTRGVNRGLYSNEAGQGSAPIAHASSKTENPIEEGMVSILEPFIDTIIICTLTGLVILSSGVWNQKFENKFEASAMVFVEGKFIETNQEDTAELRNYYYGNNPAIEYTGPIEVIDGRINLEKVTLLHNRSIAENTIVYFSEDNSLYSGSLEVKNGTIKNMGDYVLRGNSLLLGADLTGKAFTKSIFGDFGQYIVAIGLLLFAFSTVIAWSYYGDRATVHLFGEGWVFWYRVVYVAAFFTASVIDTKIVWDIATVIGPIATVPNLLALILLRKEIKKIDSEYIIKT
ncbi:MAG TPA: sodium:alanine symporter family protein [SAR86 cluster bacterium]|jgi:AGCS family alanine or glycine:cation symporter|nr:sodium:alanine symporter family protein [SAR86 cluster bacterium]HJM15229.1 sodium:alanine symporter family protein [SAR86 cluster bacterium]